ncbi:winged helix-turn-helix transcriptional regulator [Candidatus Roizmanbacteria bacterium]|nr:winged helix-turn-helix transcriptional regulator [Candidatus Roizmanbacteria bacterium]
MKRKQIFEKLASSFALLGNPLRFNIFLKIISEGCDCNIDTQRGYEGNCVSAIMKDLRIPQSTASSYIKDLERAGLIECKKNGKYLYCRPKREALVLLKSFIDSSLSQLRYK